MKIQEMRDAGIDPLVLDAGDLFFSTTKLDVNNKESELYRAEAILEGYNRIGCDAINVGHYEMLNGLTFLKEMAGKTEIPFLSANLRDSKSNELIFEPFHIIEKGEIKVGIIGVTSKLPDTCKSMIADNYIEAGNHYIDQVSKQADIIVMLVNSDRGSQGELPNHFSNADFIVTSGSTNMSRANSPQKNGGPYFYSCGKQGKYLLVVNVDIKDSGVPIVDISSHEKKLKSIKKRFERLQKKDPDKTLEEIYEKQENVLKLIAQYRDDLIQSETAINAAVNTLEFQTVALNRKVQDDPELLAFVDKSLAACSSLKSEIPTKPRIVKKERKKKDSNHAGHNH